MEFQLLPVSRACHRKQCPWDQDLHGWVEGHTVFQIIIAFLVLLKSRNADDILDPSCDECTEPVLLRGERTGLFQRTYRSEELTVSRKKLNSMVF